MTNSIQGIVALAGAGEYLPTMKRVDTFLLERLGKPAHVVVLPTAAVPDGPVVAQRWADMGTTYFSDLGVHTEAAMLRTRADAEDEAIINKLAAANFIYLSGGKPRYLLEALQGTTAWKTMQNVVATGGVIAGCSAGAMVLGEALVDFPQVWRTLPALGLVPGILVIPHFDEMPAVLSNPIASVQRKETTVGIDGSTVLAWSNGQWTVQGSGGVTVFAKKGERTRYTAGEVVSLAAPALSQSGEKEE